MRVIALKKLTVSPGRLWRPMLSLVTYLCASQHQPSTSAGWRFRFTVKQRDLHHSS